MPPLYPGCNSRGAGESAAAAEKSRLRSSTPPPPPIAEPSVAAVPAPIPPTSPRPDVAASARTTSQQKADRPNNAISIPEGTKPLSVETGNASWYGAPYHNRRSSNGEIYDMHELTAAHRTLPLGSTVRVTNLKTGHSTVVRITDRGPFVEGRIVDLSLAAAKQADIWQAGVAQVRLEVLRTPVPFDRGGRWAVQIGSFRHEDAARIRWPTGFPAATRPPRCCASAVRWATGGCASESCRMIASAPRKSPATPRLLKAKFFWSGWIEVSRCSLQSFSLRSLVAWWFVVGLFFVPVLSASVSPTKPCHPDRSEAQRAASLRRPQL